MLDFKLSHFQKILDFMHASLQIEIKSSTATSSRKSTTGSSSFFIMFSISPMRYHDRLQTITNGSACGVFLWDLPLVSPTHCIQLGRLLDDKAPVSCVFAHQAEYYFAVGQIDGSVEFFRFRECSLLVILRKSDDLKRSFHQTRRFLRQCQISLSVDSQIMADPLFPSVYPSAKFSFAQLTDISHHQTGVPAVRWSWRHLALVLFALGILPGFVEQTAMMLIWMIWPWQDLIRELIVTMDDTLASASFLTPSGLPFRPYFCIIPEALIQLL